MATMSKPELFGGNGAHGVADKARDAATDVASTAKEVAREQVSGRVNATKERAVSSLGSVAGALRNTGDSIEDNELVHDYIERAADGIEQITSYFRNKSPGEMVSDVERFARREPALFIGGAFALGLLGARFLKSSSRAELELGEDDFIEPLPRAPMRTAPITPQRTVPIGGERTGVDPFPQQHTGVVDPTKPRGGGEGSGAL